MRRLDLKMIEPGREGGAGSGEAAVHCEVNAANGKPHCPTIAQRRADSIRLQALSPLIGGA